MQDNTKPLKIAIIGSGLAGAAAAGALSKLPDVEIKVYERTREVRELGALIGVMVSAVKVLQKLMSPAAFTELQHILYRGEGTEGIHHRHWQTGEILATAISPETPRHMQEGRTGRVPLHKALMMDVPDGLVQYNSDVTKVESVPCGDNEQSRRAVIHFGDGTTEEADLAVIADGLYSRIRRQYLPDTMPKYKGQVAYRYNFPVEMISHLDLPNDTSSFKKGGETIFLSRLEPGTYSFVAFLNEPPEVASTMRWAHDLGKPGVERLKKVLEGWHPSIHEVLNILPTVDAYPLEGAPWMKDMVRDDCIAFIGDAAHPTAGAYGTGCAFAFGDVLALYRSLHRAQSSRPPTIASPNSSANASTPPCTPKPPKSGLTTDTYNVPYALHLYNETRRYFLQRVEQQLGYDKQDVEYCMAALDNYEEYVRRYRETFTINWWLLEHDVDARWQEVEAKERYTYPRAPRSTAHL